MRTEMECVPLASSLRLAAHILSKRELITQPGLRVLELGSGSGLLGTMLAKEATDARVHLTDLEGVVLDRLSETIEESELAGAVVADHRGLTMCVHLPSAKMSCQARAATLSSSLLSTGWTCKTVAPHAPPTCRP